jgi:hypothetical protein
MATRTTLDGSPRGIPIAPGGYSLEAPGLRGAVTEMTASESATRADAGTHEPPLQDALREAEIHSVKVFEIEAGSIDRSAAAEATRAGASLTTESGEPAILLRTPSLGEQTEQAVLYTDEAGVTRWIFPRAVAGGQGAPSRGGGGGTVEFLLPRDSAPLPPEADAAPGTRGPLTKLGRRLVRVLAWATEDVIGQGALAVARFWEEKRRPYGFRRVPFDDPAPVSWEALGRGRALLLIHGTFSTAPSAFRLLPAETLGSLATLYGGRVFAFDHPTLHHSPSENVQQFLGLLPPQADLELDIVCHSRGGLVTRELSERLSRYDGQGRNVRVRRAVFAGTPHRGTILTDSAHGIQMLDRYTNLFTELPDDAFTITAEALFMVAKLLYHGAIRALPGLRSMYPPGDYLQSLNAGTDHQTRYYALAADYKPRGASLLSRFGWALADAAVDGVFGEANDGVVPTRGGYELESPATGFPVRPEQRVVFGKEDVIHHCNYFGAPRVSEQILTWLGAD